MSITTRIFFYLPALVALLITLQPERVQAGEKDGFAVVELFTSQGCSSCPPADRLLTSVHQQFGDSEDVLVLSYHVDYWDYLGWNDPFSLPEATALQRKLARQLSSGVFTPQTIVNGKLSTVGSRKDQVMSAFHRGRVSRRGEIISSVRLSDDGKRVPFKLSKNEPYLLQLIGYEKFKSNQVPRGENAGRKLSHTHSVRHIQEDLSSHLSGYVPVKRKMVDSLNWVFLVRNPSDFQVLDYQIIQMNAG